jgi:tetratricopeptide (TPR) repeat protein
VASNPRIDDLRKRLEREPGSRLFAQLAEELRKTGDLDESIRVARDGLARHPQYPSARLTLARALFDLGDRGAARGELEAVVAAAPDNILAVRLLGEALEHLRLFDEAAARYRAVLELAPGDKQAEARLEALALLASAPAPAAPPAPADEAEPLLLGPAPAAAWLDPEAPIRLSTVEDEEFELERPGESSARLMGRDAEVPSAPERPTEDVDEPVGGETFGSGREELIFDFEAPPSAEAEEIAAPTLPFGRLTAPPVPALVDDDVLRPLPLQPDDEEGAGHAPVPELSSPTLAELYFTQGAPEQALLVYRQILEREPWNERARRRVGEIEAGLGHATRRALEAVPEGARPAADRREALERTIRRLEAFLLAVRENRDQWRASPTL